MMLFSKLTPIIIIQRKELILEKMVITAWSRQNSTLWYTERQVVPARQSNQTTPRMFPNAVKASMRLRYTNSSLPQVRRSLKQTYMAMIPMPPKMDNEDDRAVRMEYISSLIVNWKDTVSVAFDMTSRTL
jgi:hypothetical protein